MEIRYNVSGERRKELVSAVSAQAGVAPIYKGAPSFAYVVWNYTIGRNGELTFDDRTDSEDVELLLEKLAELGFECEPAEAPAVEPEAPTAPEIISLENLEQAGDCDVIRDADIAQTDGRLAIEIPRDGFTPEKLDNLCKMVAGKETLIKMALGVDDLPIRLLEDRISFPWFAFTEDGDKVLAYSQLITAICRTALEKQRVNAQPREDYPNPRFTMRCWLISLGLVGDDFRLIRKLMCAVPGNGAWSKGADPRKAAQAEAPAGEPAAIETEPAGDALPGEEEGADNE